MVAPPQPNDHDFLRQIARSLFSGLSVSAYTRLAQIAMHAAVARSLGSVQEYGVFALCLGSINLVALLAALGWHQIITRLVAQYQVRQDWGRLQGAMWRAFQITVGISAAVAILGMFVAPWLTVPDVYRQCLIISSICLPLITIKRLRFCELLGFHRTNIAVFLEEGAVPTIVILLAMAVRTRNSADVILWYTLGSALLAAMMTLVLYRVIPERAVGVRPQFETRTWFRSALPAVLGQSGSVVIHRADVLMIGPMLGASAVGLYSSAARIAMALGCVPLAIGAVMRPKFATAYYADNVPQVRKLFLVSLVASASLAVPIVLILIAFPSKITSTIFTAEYVSAATFLFVLVMGQLVNALTGPVAGLLLMTGREKTVGVSSGVAAIVNIVGNLIAIPRWGLVGAAMATAIAMVVQNVWRLTVAMRQLTATQEREPESYEDVLPATNARITDNVITQRQ